LLFAAVHCILELVVRQLVSQLAAALYDEHVVDDVDNELRRDLVERLPELRVGLLALEVDLLTTLTQRLDLYVFEIGLGEDLAVHLDEDLFDDVGAKHRTEQERDYDEGRTSHRLHYE